MSPANAREKREAYHEAANQKLVPFAMRLFDGQGGYLPSEGPRYLPVDDPESLTLEAVEALEQLIPIGVLGHLVLRGGWRAREVLIEGQPKRLKMSEPGIREHLGFRYGPRSIEAVLFGYNNMGPSHYVARDYTNATPLEPVYMRLEGDVMVHYIAGQRVRLFGQKTSQYFQDNPLGRLCNLAGSRRELEAAVHWLLLGPLEPILPWLADDFRESWFRKVDYLWNSIETSRQTCVQWCEVFRLWREIAVEAGLVHHLVPLVEFYRDIFKDPKLQERLREKFNIAAANMTLMESALLKTHWANALQELLAIEQIYRSLRAMHPMEREAGGQMLMVVWEKHHMDIVARRVEGFTRELLAVIG
jgi:hypothetical protein